MPYYFKIYYFLRICSIFFSIEQSHSSWWPFLVNSITTIWRTRGQWRPYRSYRPYRPTLNLRLCGRMYYRFFAINCNFSRFLDIEFHMLLEIDLHVLQHLGFVFQCWDTYSHVIPIDHIFLKCEIHVFLITFYMPQCRKFFKVQPRFELGSAQFRKDCQFFNQACMLLLSYLAWSS